jgi:hypothetical protein
MDACDLLIPGAITGWAPTSPAIVGAATVISTVLGSEEIWVRVQRGAEGRKVKGSGKEVQTRRKVNVMIGASIVGVDIAYSIGYEIGVLSLDFQFERFTI